MSIQTELTRITNAKAAIKTAIEGKGVTVPDGTLLDGMAALVESIEAGGAGFATGTLTFNESQRLSSNLTVTHNLGFAPEHILWFIIETEAKTSDNIFQANNYPISFEYISKEAYLTSANPYSDTTKTLRYNIKTSGGYLDIINIAKSNEETIELFFEYAYRSASNIPASSTIRWLVW